MCASLHPSSCVTSAAVSTRAGPWARGQPGPWAPQGDKGWSLASALSLPLASVSHCHGGCGRHCTRDWGWLGAEGLAAPWVRQVSEPR